MSSAGCEVCGNDSFDDGDDGFMYCTRCNSQAAEYIETGLDEADGLYGADGQPIYSSKYAHKAAPTPVSLSHPAAMEEDAEGPTGPSDFGSDPASSGLSYDDYYSEIRCRYALGFQIMLQSQVKALVEKCGVSPLVVGLAGPLWLRFLAVQRVMADEWADEAIHESESQIQGEAATFHPVAKHRMEPHTMFGQRAVMIWLSSLRSMIPLSYSLAISFLVCHVAREAVLPTDIIKWALEGKLPYFNAFVEIEKQLGPPSRACPISSSLMFRPNRMMPLQKLGAFAALIAQDIGLELPPVNFHGLAARFLVQLSIPHNNILRQACRIYEWSMATDLFLLANEARLPTCVCVMAILIVTMRILYDLNGWGTWEMSLLTSVSSSSAEENVDRPLNSTFASDDAKENFSSLYENTSDDDDLELHAVSLLRILEAKFSEITDTHDYCKNYSLYLKYLNDVVFADSRASNLDHKEEKLIESLWDFYETNKLVKQPEDQEMHPQHKDQAMSDTAQSSMEKHRDEAIRQLKLNMEENRFLYIPPRKQVKKRGYFFYSRKRIQGSYVYACHADYYILLRACAGVAQIDLRILHLGVLKFERRLKELEGRIDQCFLNKAARENFDEVEHDDSSVSKK